MDDSTKNIVKVVALAGGALALYWWLKQSGYWDLWFPSTVAQPVITPGNPLVMQAPITVSPSIPANYTQAMGVMQQAAGVPTQDFDQWSYWWQNTPAFAGAPAGFGSNGSISPTMIDAMIAAGGGNRSLPISASQWVSLLYQQQQNGVSGLPRTINLTQIQPEIYGWKN